MKKITLISSLLTSVLALTQNLVPNPSFEEYSSCPNLDDQLQYSTGWSSYAGTCDYYNSCSSEPFFSVPNNMFENYQPSADGMAYAGFYSYQTNISNNREYLGSKLINPLVKGKTYFVSAKFANAIDINQSGLDCTINKLGILFSEEPYTYQFQNPLLTSNFAHIYSNTIVSDTMNWTEVSGYFVADSSYEYIYIGNFFDDNNTDTMIYMDDNTFGWHISYTFVDDISVIEDTLNSLFEKKQNGIYIYYDEYLKTTTIKFNSTSNNSLTLYNNLGKKIETHLTNEPEIILNHSNLSSGLYFLNLNSENKSYTKKIRQ